MEKKVLLSENQPEFGAGLKKALTMKPADVVFMVRDSGMKGLGGAGFPTGVKWNLAGAASADRKYVVCNADEGEPGTFKDRILLEKYPERLLEGMAIGGYAIEPGTQLWVAQWVVHRDARWFPNPESFSPERWDDDLARKLPKHAYFPFGGGPRICIGNAFAMMEAVLALVTIVRHAAVAPAPDAKPMALVPSVTLRPKHGVRLLVRKRQRSAASKFA